MAYQNFMGNKDFHPSSFRNIRKLYEAEEKVKQEVSRQEELRLQYLREQEVYKNKELMGKANPLGFMYEPPPGYEKDKEKVQGGDGNGEPLLKFDWQKAGRAPPREAYAKGMDLRDQPFGIEVRNVKCIKCGKWGHINTDRVCPLFGKAKPVAAVDQSATTDEGDNKPVAPAPLPDLDTVEDGLIFKQCVRDRVVDSLADNQQILASDEETEIQDLLGGLSRKERKRVLKKLSRLKSKEVGVVSSSDKKEKKKKKHSHSKKKRSRHSPDPSPDDSTSSSQDDHKHHRHSDSRETRTGDPVHKESDRRRHKHRTRDRSPHR